MDPNPPGGSGSSTSTIDQTADVTLASSSKTPPAHTALGFRFRLYPRGHVVSLQPPRTLAMDPEPQRPKGRNRGVFSTLDVAIEYLNFAREKAIIAPAKAVFGLVCDLLPTIRDSTVHRRDYVKLGLACADVCRVLDRGLNSKHADQLNETVFEAIQQLTTTVGQIQRSVVELGERNFVSRIFLVNSDKETIAAWRSDLDRILLIFETELALHTHVAVSVIRHDVAGTREIVSEIRTIVKDQGVRNQAILALSREHSILGESPPPPPRACFGRGDLIEKIVGLVETLTPVALIGAGGIGKTSIALTVLHDDRVKRRFGENRRFIRCDQFQAAHSNFLNRLSEVIGAGVKNPENLTPLRPFLSSTGTLIILDNAESILDPQGVDAQKLYAVVEELSQISNISLCITSRITTIPSDCKRLDVPTLSMDASRSAFYRICDNDEQPDIIDTILERLDFHPLSVTLLATVAHQNNWDNTRLGREWELRQTSVLETEHKNSLAAAIELSLTSPMFRELGPDARELLGVVAFFPQGINENNLDWLFPTIADRRNIIDRFCILSLTSRSNGFITMLAPLRDHFAPRDPRTSPLLCKTKDHYFSRLRLSSDFEPDRLGFKESKWITTEDVNVEHLIDVFTSLHTDTDDIWVICADFILHLYAHKPRSTVLGPKIEGLPDGHASKRRCLLRLSLLSRSIGNHAEAKRLLIHNLELERGQRNDDGIAHTLRYLADANQMLGLYEEGIRESKEALEIYERLGDVKEQAKCWNFLGRLLLCDKQYDAAEEAGSHAIKLALEEGREYWVCGSHRLLGEIHRSKGEREKAIRHFEAALGVASSFEWYRDLFRINCSLAQLFCDEDEFGRAQAHIDQAKSHAVGDKYCLGRAADTQALIWYRQGRLEEATAKVLSALKTFERLGATSDIGRCRDILQRIELAAESSYFSCESDDGAYGTPSSTLTSIDHAPG
ncbi:hypothetical protein BJ322DRAFT_1194331 [Thelephora terrestris]|uniref:NB-ARC domain-containing protein n=1 Tax=Thelephora terrestris TaxID=56493 RepID=A0A9P6HF11_9AGAM|nr:hypothetical protein BJ322DRAFT_1194331 [Thelephora terrestris]